jgi:transaldolase
MPTLEDLALLGQSVWLDVLSRDMLDSGELQRFIDLGVRGETDNPSIMDKAVSESDRYDDDIRVMAQRGMTAEAIYEALALDDVGQAADLFRPLYEEACRADGYVSLEVEPALADDTRATINRARHLFRRLNRPNTFIKVPATDAGIPAIEALISEGININITLMFSLAQYRAVAEAYLCGLEKYLDDDGDLSQVASVASFFVSRVDSKVDKALAGKGADDLMGTIAVANAKVVYAEFQRTFTGERWARLAGQGARVQRPLWASTSTKNPHYSDTLYVDELIGPRTVNTMPIVTLEAFLQHGRVDETVTQDLDGARRRLARLREVGVDLDAITRDLTTEGVQLFADSYNHLIGVIEDKRMRYWGERAA